MFKKPTQVYRPIFKKAWEITKQNRFLWIFGLFAALAGNGGIYEILFKGFGRIVGKGDLAAGSSWSWIFETLSYPRLEDIYVRSPLFVSLLWVLFFAILGALGL